MDTGIDILLIVLGIVIVLDWFSPELTEEMRRKRPVLFWLFLIVGVTATLLFLFDVIDILSSVIDFVPNIKALTGDGSYDNVWFYLSGVGLVIVLPAAIYTYLRIKKDKKTH